MKSEFRADLHTHSSCSDGTDTPLVLLGLAKAAGLSGLSITDHDTIQAYTQELYDTAGQIGLELLIGSEISSEMEGMTVHILGYGFDKSFGAFLQEALVKRKERNRKILEKLKKKGISITEEELRSFGPEQILGRPHIAEALIRKGVVATMHEAFDRFLKDDASCYVIGGKFHPREVIAAIQKARGKAVLAHPHFLKAGRFLRELLSLPFDGIECYYGRSLIEQERPWLEIAAKKGFLATGGSDYHGTRRPHITLGCSWVNETTFRKLCSSNDSSPILGAPN